MDELERSVVPWLAFSASEPPNEGDEASAPGKPTGNRTSANA